MTAASICTIGDEILIGQIVDTNSSAIARSLGSIGIKINHMVSIGDQHDEIVSTLRNELENNDIVIVTGGLGPTRDDITKQALADLTGSTGYRMDAAQLAIIHEILASRGLDMMEVNRLQASVPDTCEVIPNKKGTAPIMVFRIGTSGKTLYSMPGVPFETLGALPDVLEDIRRHHPALQDIRHRNIMTFGIAESALAEKIASWEDALPEDMHLAYLPNPLTGVKLRLSIYGGNAQDDDRRMQEQISRLKDILGDTIYAEQEDRLEHVIGEILKATGKTLSAAESCTGGEISHLLTTVPGSSAYYLGSVTSYAVPVKEKVLGVPPETIEKYGVVSSEVAAAMAEGVRKITGSDFSVSTTGLAGPGGGDGTNPEGTVWVAVSSALGTQTKKFLFHNDRKRNIERFAASALFFLLEVIRRETAV